MGGRHPVLRAALDMKRVPSLLSALLATAWTLTATGQSPASAPSTTPEAGSTSPAPAPSAAEDAEEPPPAPVPAAKDLVGGHFSGALGLALTLPWGALEDRYASSSTLGAAPRFELQLMYGLGRSVMLGAWADLAHHSGGSACSSCSATSLGLGLLARYHLIQGTRLDPWVGAGLGWRRLSLDAGHGEGLYSGMEWLKLELGADWYLFDKLALGPWLGVRAASFLAHPGAGPSGVDGAVDLGLRLITDFPGK